MKEETPEHLSYSLVASHQSKGLVRAISSAPGMIYLGKLPLKPALRKPATEQVLRLHFKKQIERKFLQKWSY